MDFFSLSFHYRRRPKRALDTHTHNDNSKILSNFSNFRRNFWFFLQSHLQHTFFYFYVIPQLPSGEWKKNSIANWIFFRNFFHFSIGVEWYRKRMLKSELVIVQWLRLSCEFQIISIKKFHNLKYLRSNACH